MRQRFGTNGGSHVRRRLVKPAVRMTVHACMRTSGGSVAFGSKTFEAVAENASLEDGTCARRERPARSRCIRLPFALPARRPRTDTSFPRFQTYAVGSSPSTAPGIVASIRRRSRMRRRGCHGHVRACVPFLGDRRSMRSTHENRTEARPCAVQAYLLRIFDQSRYFHLRSTVERYFGGRGETAEAGAEGNRTPSFVPVEGGLDRGRSTGEVRSGPSTPSWIAKTVLSSRSFFGLSSSGLPRNGFSKTASEIPCTTQQPGIEIKHLNHRDLSDSFDVMPSKISNRGVVVACRRSVDDGTAR